MYQLVLIVFLFGKSALTAIECHRPPKGQTEPDQTKSATFYQKSAWCGFLIYSYLTNGRKRFTFEATIFLKNIPPKVCNVYEMSKECDTSLCPLNRMAIVVCILTCSVTMATNSWSKNLHIRSKVTGTKMCQHLCDT